MRCRPFQPPRAGHLFTPAPSGALLFWAMKEGGPRRSRLSDHLMTRTPQGPQPHKRKAKLKTWLMPLRWAGEAARSARLLGLILAYPRQRTAERASSGCRDPMLIGVNCNLD